VTSDFGSLIDELETVALASREQRYPIANVGPATVSGNEVDGLRELLGFVRCETCRIWIAPEDDRCPRCEVPVHRKGGETA
jgi:uncharacterized paraquat-inducible protein A